MHLFAFVDRVVTDIITPALDRRFAVTRVSLLCQETELGLAYDIAGVCRSQQLPVEVVTVPPDNQPLALRQRLSELLHGPLCLNLSAASPVQAALAFELARQRQLPVMALDHRRDRLIWLSGGEQQPLRSGSDIADGLALEDYFALYGCRLRGTRYRLWQRDLRLETLAAGLAARAATHPHELTLLNRLCNELDARQFSRRLLPRSEHFLRHWLQQSGMVMFDNIGHLRCNDAPARLFLSGGWLEIWLLSLVARMAPHLPVSDAAVGVKVSHRGVENEYDVAILCNNQLFLVECKTTAPASLGQHGIGLDNLFKLDSAARLGGLDAQAMLVSLYPPTVSEYSRAKGQGIATLAGEALLQADDTLRRWLLGRLD
ncbi:Card1-like endonuclease domain-containing protein [Vogesella oryzae]|uniref:Card1-like endonuclease domain-containing protein n=1 Tax=Vogesella oryzae TaxID=1735285 RepID=UPI001581DC4A|nr:DUF1887 family CARF protein [Vogesella oryzae]